jgi:hypothetical protein
MRFRILLAALACAGAATPVIATTYTATYTGKIGFGFDTTGMFGGASASLNEVDYRMVYTIDDAAPGAAFGTTPTTSGISGSGTNGPVRLAITIKGVTHVLNGSQIGTAATIDELHVSGAPYNGLVDKVSHSSKEYSYTPAFYHGWSAETYISSYAQNFVTSPDFRVPVIYDGTTGTDSQYNLVELNDYDYVTRTQVNYAYMNMRIGEYTFAQVAAPPTGNVPEPASWALLVAGFGLTGGVMRRRRRSTAAVTA